MSGKNGKTGNLASLFYNVYRNYLLYSTIFSEMSAIPEYSNFIL